MTLSGVAANPVLAATLEKERIIIIGADSKLGTEFENYLRNSNINVVSTTRRRERVDENGRFFLDLADETIRVPTWGTVVYLVAAITKVVDCDANPQAAWRINADAPVAITLAAKKAGVFPVFISSDAVERAPNLAYSRAKAYAEGIVLATGGAVIRPSRIPIGAHIPLLALMLEVGARRAIGLHRWEP